MMNVILQPKKTKFKYAFKRYNRFLKRKNSKTLWLWHGQYGLQVLWSKWISNRQLEAIWVDIMRRLNKFKVTGKNHYYCLCFPDLPLSKKEAGSWMGHGKPDVYIWVAWVRKYHILFELNDVSFDLARWCFKATTYKLGIGRCRFIYWSKDTNDVCYINL